MGLEVVPKAGAGCGGGIYRGKTDREGEGTDGGEGLEGTAQRGEGTCGRSWEDCLGGGAVEKGHVRVRLGIRSWGEEDLRIGFGGRSWEEGRWEAASRME